MRRMEKITGRSDDMLIVRGVNVFPTQIEEQILKVKGLAPHYQIVLTREGRLDEMEVLVEAAPAGAAADARQKSAAELAPPHQGPDRRDGQDHRHRPRRRRAQPGQGPPRHRQAAEGIAPPSLSAFSSAAASTAANDRAITSLPLCRASAPFRAWQTAPKSQCNNHSH